MAAKSVRKTSTNEKLGRVFVMLVGLLLILLAASYYASWVSFDKWLVLVGLLLAAAFIIAIARNMNDQE